MMKIQAYLVPEHTRIHVFPRHFGRYMLTVEQRVYSLMSRFASRYSGGSWRFLELSNGGFYMRPPDSAYELCIDSNGFRGCMSGDAAGIVVCLFAFGDLYFKYSGDMFIDHFHRLRDFALNHAEVGVIVQAID